MPLEVIWCCFLLCVIRHNFTCFHSTIEHKFSALSVCFSVLFVAWLVSSHILSGLVSSFASENVRSVRRSELFRVACSVSAAIPRAALALARPLVSPLLASFFLPPPPFAEEFFLPAPSLSRVLDSSYLVPSRASPCNWRPSLRRARPSGLTSFRGVSTCRPSSSSLPSACIT